MDKSQNTREFPTFWKLSGILKHRVRDVSYTHLDVYKRQSAKRLKIPVFHMEAGNRCKDENLPEEVIRRIVDVTSDVNLCYSCLLYTSRCV